ncbi:344_t:CDS:2 [Gigaspora margarita]|uniref:344_t:CDS:1 n=1 Tax=Gigaspora margarita TaxID=4874 RepID=A0ABM8VX01_GIGMA|nr:344_t:CDS:2 [Gigaspora margarita]
MTCDNLKNKFEGFYDVDACHNNITDRCPPNLWDANNLCDGGYYSCGPKASITNAFCSLYASQAVKQYLNVSYTIVNGSVVNAIAVADFGTDIHGENSDRTNMVFGETNIKCYYNIATGKSPIHFWGHPMMDVLKLGMWAYANMFLWNLIDAFNSQNKEYFSINIQSTLSSSANHDKYGNDSVLSETSISKTFKPSDRLINCNDQFRMF